MLKSLFKFPCLIIMILTTNAYSQNPYSAPEFSDQHRLDKIQKVFPKIQKIYQDYAKKKSFSGVCFWSNG